MYAINKKIVRNQGQLRRKQYNYLKHVRYTMKMWHGDGHDFNEIDTKQQ